MNGFSKFVFIEEISFLFLKIHLQARQSACYKCGDNSSADPRWQYRFMFGGGTPCTDIPYKYKIKNSISSPLFLKINSN